MAHESVEISCKGSRLLITSSAAADLIAYLNRGRFSRCFFISDQIIYPLYGAAVEQAVQRACRLPISHYLLPPGETAKALTYVGECWQEMHHFQMDRAGIVISMGGGVVSDLAGFAASCYMRGIQLVHIPTTLLAMVDASIGGKTGVNLPSGKNLIGTFYQPGAVFIDPHFLVSLPEKELCSGMAEVIKYGVIKDPSLFEFLERNMQKILALEPIALHRIIEASCRIKAEIVEKDEKEGSSGLRAILNYGHTFGHALESLTKYSFYSHGEAVAIGMCCAADTSLRLGLVDPTFVQRQEALCLQAGLPIRCKQPLDENEWLKLMLADKKVVASRLKLVLPTSIGSVRIVDDVDPSLILAVLKGRMGNE